MAARSKAAEPTEAWVCHDCAHLIANGETPAEMSEEETEAWLDGMDDNAWALGDDCDDFSWSPCDSCGSRLGGARHRAWTWEP